MREQLGKSGDDHLLKRSSFGPWVAHKPFQEQHLNVSVDEAHKSPLNDSQIKVTGVQ
jgi:hypothetical protein